VFVSENLSFSCVTSVAQYLTSTLGSLQKESFPPMDRITK